jgi:broad specificity phosphatase PhoE
VLIAATLSLPDPTWLPGLGDDAENDTLSLLRRLQATAWTAIERFKEDHGADDQILAVTPVSTVQATVCRALSMPLEDFQRFRIDPGSLTIIDFRVQQNRTLLLTLNETCHLARIEAF